jgi:putative endonuclease
MFYVYLIRSISFPDQVYVGITEDLKKRLETHNSGGSVYTAKYKLWELIVYMGFKKRSQSKAF